jgi:serine/threonine protein kinase
VDTGAGTGFHLKGELDLPAFRPLGPTDPTEIASYRVTGRIGEGSQGVVYAAEARSGERVAVKLLHRRFSDDEQVRRAFGAELRQAQRVTDPRVAKILAYGIHDLRLYYASQYVEGTSLWDVVERQGPRPAGELAGLAIATLGALAAVHAAGAAHGDFKPGSVLLGPEGPRIIDVGVGRALEGPAAAGRLVGTSPFTAPEHLAGTVPGSESDMFAWAGTMVYAATGRAPFGQDSVPAVINRILNGVPDLSSLAGGLLDAVTACMDKVPARRPSARELLDRLEGAPVGPAALSPAPGPAATPPWPYPPEPPETPWPRPPEKPGSPATPPSYGGPIPLSSRPLWSTSGRPALRGTQPGPTALREAGPGAPPPPGQALALAEDSGGPDRHAMAQIRRRRRRNRAIAAAAGGLVIVAVVAVVASSVSPSRRQVPGAAPPPALLPATTPATAPASAPPVTPSMEPTPIPSPSKTGTKRTAEPAPSWKAGTTRVFKPVLVVSPARVRVESDYIFYVNIKLKARGAAVRWHASITEGSVLSSSKGVIRAGGSATITAYGTPYCSTSSVRFTSNGGKRTVKIIWGGPLCSQ